MLKSALRKEALIKRNALSEEAFEMLNQQLLAQFKTIELAQIKSIHIFLPIITKREPDTFLFIDYLEEKHPDIQIIVSKSDFDNSLLSHYTYAGRADLLENSYNIPEPQTAMPFLGIPDLILVPLLAFDKFGYRVGYGKGFYDRLLSGNKTMKIGISLFDAVDKINDVHLNDIKLDQCITPSKIVNFNRNMDQEFKITSAKQYEDTMISIFEWQEQEDPLTADEQQQMQILLKAAEKYEAEEL